MFVVVGERTTPDFETFSFSSRVPDQEGEVATQGTFTRLSIGKDCR